MFIKSSNKLCTDYVEISKLAHGTEEPIYITQDGEGDLVLMSIEAFEKREESIKLRVKLELASGSDSNLEKIHNKQNNDVISKNEGVYKMTEFQLGNILKEMYSNAPKGDQVAHIHLFGIKFADVLENQRLSKKEILNNAGLPESYQTEISKGIRLAKYVIIKE